MTRDHSNSSLQSVIVLIGTELTAGTIQDAHGKFLANLVTAFGIAVKYIVLVPDGPLIVDQLRTAIASADLLLAVGGIGPTSDDVTREAVAEVAQARLCFRGDLWRGIETKLKGYSRGIPVAQSNRKQAEIPSGFTAIDNTCGTAPGFWGEILGTTVVVMPGPPREMRQMTGLFLEPFLKERYAPGTIELFTGTSFIIGESHLEDVLSETNGGSLRWRTRAEDHRIVFSLYSGGAVGNTDSKIRTWQRLLDRFGPLCVVTGETTAAEMFFQALKAKNLKLVTAESCTGGLIAKMMTDLPGSSQVYWGGYNTYANDAKERLLGVSTVEQFGAVSRETVVQMAEGALAHTPADVAVAISGIAGPDGGTEEKPVGTVWIGIKLRGKAAHAWVMNFRGDRRRIRLRSAIAALRLSDAVVNGQSVDNEPIWAYI